jgi:hypothetical protein
MTDALAQGRLQIVPCSISDANAFVRQHHRHHRPVHEARFAIAAARNDKVVGVAIVGNPVARLLADGWTAEVVRLTTDGTRNCCSMLYRACWRICRNMGYRKLITYTLPEEGGSSLRGAGFRCLGVCGGGTWDRRLRPRVDKHPTQGKLRWEVTV